MVNSYIFWAKICEELGKQLPLLHHSADVAAVHEALLRQTILGRRLASLGGLEECKLQPVQIARLSVLAAIHDAGKANLRFQNRRPGAGHLSEIADTVLGKSACPAKRDLHRALALEVMQDWVEDDGLVDFLTAAFSHHGRPIPPKRKIHTGWEVRDGLDPVAEVARLVKATQRWFPEAWQAGGPPLPKNPPFHHAWLGLLTLADWIGSDSERFFRFFMEGASDRMELARRRAKRALKQLGLTTAPARSQLGLKPRGYWFMEAALGQPFTPRPAQARILDLEELAGGSLVVLEAATGSGKTEAALGHFVRLLQQGEVDGLYFALPTRTAATQIYRRVCQAVEAAFPGAETRPPTVLAVPGYLSVDGQEGIALKPFEVSWPADGEGRLARRGWAAESSKRYLAGAVAVGTIDQVLLSSLQVPHSHMRACSLLRHLLVVDEVHASDTYMTRILEAVLDLHLGAGGHALLMSATLGSAARIRLTAPPGSPRNQTKASPLEEAANAPYPALVTARQRTGWESKFQVVDGPTQEKMVAVELDSSMAQPEKIAGRALAAARCGARVLIIRNTVAGCLEVQHALEDLADDPELLLHCQQRPTPHHGRYAAADRRLLDDAVEAAFGKERFGAGLVAVATQTVEQSLDLDADLLITDLTPLDVLLQRIGRLHRHSGRTRPDGFATARVLVLTPDHRDLTQQIGDSGAAPGPHGVGTVYPDLRILEATWSELERRGRLELPLDNRALVEAATHPEALDAVTTRGGEVWRAHERFLLGEELADQQSATVNLVDRTVPFFDLEPFPTAEDRRVTSRLGESDRRARFETPAPSPFGADIEIIKIPARMARGVPTEAEFGEEVEPLDGGGFKFRYGPYGYRYDRLGLTGGSALTPTLNTEESS